MSSTRKRANAVFFTVVMVLSLFAIASVSGTAGAASQTLTVDDDFPTGEDTDPDTEYRTLQAAVDDAQPGATIEVKEGSYNPVDIDKEVDLVAVGDRADTTIVGNSNYAVNVTQDDASLSGFTIVAQGGAFGLLVEDLGDVSDTNFVAEGNHFVSANGQADFLAYVEDSHQVTIQNNEFSGQAYIALYLDAQSSTVANNEFNVDAGDGSQGGMRGAVITVLGTGNSLQNNHIGFPSNAIAGLILTGSDHTVTDLTVHGHLDEHQHESDRLDYAVWISGIGHDLSTLDVQDSEVGVFVDEASDIMLTDVSSKEHKYFDGGLGAGYDLYVGSDTTNVRTDDFAAMSSQVDTNVEVHGTDHTLSGVTSTTDTPQGIYMTADQSSVMGAMVSNKATGITLADTTGSGVTTSDIQSNGIGIHVLNSEDATIENNNGITSNTVGVSVSGSNATVIDNSIENNNVGLEVDDTSQMASNVDANWNDIVDNNAGIQNHGANDVMAEMNWYGSEAGPGGAGQLSAMSTLGHGDTVSDGVMYDPFLTAPKDNVPHSWDQVEQFGHDFELEGDEGWQTIAFPGAGEDDVGTTLGDLGNRQGVMVWAYDQDDPQGPWLTGNQLANRSVESLDAFIVTGLDDDAEVTMDHLDSTSPPNGPGQEDLDPGWNFVGAPQDGQAQTVYQSTSNLGRLVHVYEQPESQPYGSAGDANPFQDNFATSASSDVSPYTGYWVWSDSDGELSAVMPGGVSACDETTLLNQSQTCPP